ncbi:alcohol oxidase [Mycena floridula]|nr:alcohol oxidase [Mycena floridula]
MANKARPSQIQQNSTDQASMWPFSTNYPVCDVSEAGAPFDDTTTLKSRMTIIVGDESQLVHSQSGFYNENPAVSVLVLERGDIVDTWDNRAPLLSGNPFKKGSLMKPWISMPLKAAGNRTVTMALGGGSRVNAMLHTRGVPGFYNGWCDRGYPDWSYENVKPFFNLSEKSQSQTISDFRGASGVFENHTFPPSEQRLANSLRRVSTYSVFLPASVARARLANLKVCTHALTTRILFSSEAGQTKAVTVEFAYNDRKRSHYHFVAKANQQVILCAGALGTPQLLLLSGVGPVAHLKEHGINLVLDSPGVGNYLKDHVDVPTMWNIPIDDSLLVLFKKPGRALLELSLELSYLYEAMFLPSRLLDGKANIINLQAHDLDATLPHNVPDLEIKPFAISGLHPTPDFVVTDGVGTIMTCLLQAKSVATVRLKSTDAHDPPKCDLSLLSDPDDDINAHIRANGCTGYHYTSSCRMASFAEAGVVDGQLRVHGIKNLMICDASVFPESPPCHTKAPVIMLAEKCAKMLQDA